MGTNTKISWTEQTWNPLAGCSPVGPECLHCYAATMAKRLEAMGQAKYKGTAVRRGSVDVFTGKINLDYEALKAPLKRKKSTMYFVNSMSDLFHEAVDFEFIAKVFAIMGLAEQHTFQVLTKRPERMANFFRWLDHQWEGLFPHGPAPLYRDGNIAFQFLSDEEAGTQVSSDYFPPDWPLPNVWLGVSCGIQKAKPRIDQLREIPAAIRFVSFEPLLEDLGEIDLSGINWAITGGESGPQARPCNVEWIRSIGMQCQATGVAWWNKQMGANVRAHASGADGFHWPKGTMLINEPIDENVTARFALKDRAGADPSEWPEDLRVQQMPEVIHA